jgi:hypothetical protein
VGICNGEIKQIINPFQVVELYPNYRPNAEVIHLNMRHFSSVNIRSFKGAGHRDFDIKKTANFNDNVPAFVLIFIALN